MENIYSEHMACIKTRTQTAVDGDDEFIVIEISKWKFEKISKE